MTVSVESLGGLKRKMTISIPADQFDKEFDARIKKLAHKVKIDGFRPGKVPVTLIKQRYGMAVTRETAQELMQSSLYQALQSQNLVPVATPEIEPESMLPGQDFSYHATFEIFPEFTVVELDGETVDLVSCVVQDSDVDDMIENLRQKNKIWHPVAVARAAQLGDKVVIDFEGFIADKPFDGGKAENFELILGSGAMIPGFEDALLGQVLEQPITINLSFPVDYAHPDLAGKEARFVATIKQILEGQLPDVNDEFAQLFHVKSGGVDALRLDIKENMARELTRRVSSVNREAIFDALLKKNQFEIPLVLINQEIEHLKHEMYHQMFGSEHRDNEKIPDFPRSIFEEKATRRVHLGLLFSEYVKKHNIQVDSARVDAMIDMFAGAYEHPEEVRSWYKNDANRLKEIESLVMEELVADQIVSTATITQRTASYAEIMAPSQQQDAKGA